MKKTAIVGSNCVSCGNCVNACPIGAVYIHKGITAVVTDKCIGCGKCEKACPAGIIEIVKREDIAI